MLIVSLEFQRKTLEESVGHYYWLFFLSLKILQCAATAAL